MKRLVLGLISAVALVSFQAPADAVPINITVDAAGALLNGTGVANNTQYGQGNNNPDSNLTFLQGLISNWNNANINPDVPPAVGPADPTKSLDSMNVNGTYETEKGFDYVVLHFGNGGLGSPGGWWQAYYLADLGGTITLPQVGGRNVGGFSSARYFNANGTTSVPDGGSTLMLLGLAVGGAGTLRRYFGK